jgi:hypothetical protein
MDELYHNFKQLTFLYVEQSNLLTRNKSPFYLFKNATCLVNNGS